MAFSTTQLQALETAIATGRLSVSYDGRTVTYQSTEKLIAAYNLVRNQLIADGTIPQPGGVNRGPAALSVFCRD